MQNTAQMPAWRFHDCRCTAVSWMATAGYTPHIADRLLNQLTVGQISAMGAFYQRAEFLEEPRARLEGWANHLQEA